MTRATVRPRSDRALLDIRSIARRGRQDRIALLAQVEQIARTVGRVPEVMVKVSGGAKSIRGAIAHLQYIDRRGKLEIETDEGLSLKGKHIEPTLLALWDLESADARARRPYAGKAGRKPGKLVHNVILSMPHGTPPEKLLAASRAFAREQFGLQHRYAMVLHTDQDHPHVHLVIKAVGEQGERLNIRKATLRDWRREFARQLRAQGIAANATERAVRGRSASSLKDSIYRAALRGDSRYLEARVARVHEQLRSGGLTPTPGKETLLETRRVVMAGWLNVADELAAAGHGALAEQTRDFVRRMSPAHTTDERLALAMAERKRGREQDPERAR